MDKLYRSTFLHIARKNLAILNHIVTTMNLEGATLWRDNGEGWTVTEVVGHLAEFDVIFYNRAVSLVEQDYPTFPTFDEAQLAIDQRYNEQSVLDFLAQLNASRATFMAFFDQLSEEQWQRAGVHPEYGEWKVERSLAQIASHDSTHLEQITRIIAEKKTQP